jgi:Cro/C1-type HTH DNA-binding domain
MTAVAIAPGSAFMAEHSDSSWRVAFWLLQFWQLCGPPVPPRSAVLVGITDQNVSSLKSGNANGTRFDTLAGICEAPDCQPGDSLEAAPQEPNQPRPWPLDCAAMTGFWHHLPSNHAEAPHYFVRQPDYGG